VGVTDLEGAQRQIDMALDAGVNLIDTADIYSAGAAKSILARSERPARSRAARHESPVPHGPRSEARWALAAAPHRGVRGEPAPDRYRSHLIGVTLGGAVVLAIGSA
jgi:hypothetical protein